MESYDNARLDICQTIGFNWSASSIPEDKVPETVKTMLKSNFHTVQHVKAGAEETKALINQN